MVGLDRDSWGLDHGTWSVLTHMFPDAHIPVLQLSINALQPLEHPDFELAVPTPDHLIPLLYFAGVAAASGSRPEGFAHGYTYGSLSMTCYTTGVAPCTAAPQSSSDPQPRSDEAPPEQTNI